MISYHHCSLEQKRIFFCKLYIWMLAFQVPVDLSNTVKQSIFKMNDDANCSQRRNLSQKEHKLQTGHAIGGGMLCGLYQVNPLPKLSLIYTLKWQPQAKGKGAGCQQSPSLCRGSPASLRAPGVLGGELLKPRPPRNAKVLLDGLQRTSAPVMEGGCPVGPR